MSPEPVVTNQHVWLSVLTAVTFGDLLPFLCLLAEDIKPLFSAGAPLPPASALLRDCGADFRTVGKGGFHRTADF